VKEHGAMTESYIVRVYRREKINKRDHDSELEEYAQISGVVEDIQRGLREPFHTAEDLWRLISSTEVV
jgi:uncharacterized protein (UPF0147 family)